MGEGKLRNQKCYCGSGKKYKHCCMNKIFISKEELETHFLEQIQFLVTSARLYDSGFKAEAKRMSVITRNLVHDTKNSHSILKQMNKKDMLFYDTAQEINPLNLLPHNGLCIHKITSGEPEESGWVPRLNDSPFPVVKVDFESWWNKKVIKDSYGKIFTRKDLVLNVSNTDGGAHVDPKLNINYFNLTRKNSMAWKLVINGIEYDYNAPHLPSIRQIAHEILLSIKDEFDYKVDYF